jgi:hypothetical protein
VASHATEPSATDKFSADEKSRALKLPIPNVVLIHFPTFPFIPNHRWLEGSALSGKQPLVSLLGVPERSFEETSGRPPHSTRWEKKKAD